MQMIIIELIILCFNSAKLLRFLRLKDRMGYKKYIKRENPASLAKSLQEVNSEGQYLHVQAEGFGAKNSLR